MDLGLEGRSVGRTRRYAPFNDGDRPEMDHVPDGMPEVRPEDGHDDARPPESDCAHPDRFQDMRGTDEFDRTRGDHLRVPSRSRTHCASCRPDPDHTPDERPDGGGPRPVRPDGRRHRPNDDNNLDPRRYVLHRDLRDRHVDDLGRLDPGPLWHVHQRMFDPRRDRPPRDDRDDGWKSTGVEKDEDRRWMTDRRRDRTRRGRDAAEGVVGGRLVAGVWRVEDALHDRHGPWHTCRPKHEWMFDPLTPELGPLSSTPKALSRSTQGSPNVG